MTKDELKLNYEDILIAHGVINVGRYKVTETGQVLKMTKDELEKEAEEFTDSKKSFWRQGRTCIDSVKQAYIAGAEFGYKKANEWHYVKDGKLPTHSNRVFVFTDEGVGFGLYGLDNKKWYTYDTGFDVVAWKEIVLPELPKESE